MDIQDNLKMNPTTPLHEDTLNNLPPETPIRKSLVQNIMKSLPMEVRPSFNDQFSKFRKHIPDNVRLPATFLFLAQFVDELEKNYRSTPYLYDLDLTLSNIWSASDRELLNLNLSLRILLTHRDSILLNPVPCVQ